VCFLPKVHWKASVWMKGCVEKGKDGKWGHFDRFGDINEWQRRIGLACITQALIMEKHCLAGLTIQYPFYLGGDISQT